MKQDHNLKKVFPAQPCGLQGKSAGIGSEVIAPANANLSLVFPYKYLYIANMKPLKFIGSSEDDLAEFPKEAKGAAGHELWQIQLGLMPSDWKPMLNVGAGAYEIRVHVLGEWRVIYVAKFSDAIYTLKGTRTC